MRLLRIFVLLAVLGAVAASIASAAGLGGNPANNPGLLREPIEGTHYDYGKRCVRGERPGAVALAGWLDRHFHGQSWGIYRCEKLSPGNFSIHAEGRALDWHLDAGRAADRRAAVRLIELLLARDRRGNDAALARRMGIQGLIWNCRTWFAGMERIGPYSYCYGAKGKRRKGLNRTAAHMDHIHIELNWAGARMRTSFWRSPLAGK